MLNKAWYCSLILVLGLFFTSTLNSCTKNRDSQASIFVQDQMGNPIGGAKVRLYSNSGYIDVLKTTFSDGSADFSFENEAILFIDVDKDTYTSVTGEYVRLEPGEIVEKIIVLQ